MAAKSTALTTGRELGKKPNSTDRRRWYLFRQRMSVEEICAREKCSLEAFQNSLTRMEAYRASVSTEEIEMAMNAIVLRRLPEADKALGDALKAKVVTRQQYVDNKGRQKSKVISTEPDHGIRLQAHDRLQRMADRMIPKGGGVAVNVQQNNAGGGESQVRAGRSFEDILRERRRERGLSDGMTVDAEYVDASEIDESADDHDDAEEPDAETIPGTV
jgi:hypothetical protein